MIREQIKAWIDEGKDPAKVAALAVKAVTPEEADAYLYETFLVIAEKEERFRRVEKIAARQVARHHPIHAQPVATAINRGVERRVEQEAWAYYLAARTDDERMGALVILQGAVFEFKGADHEWWTTDVEVLVERAQDLNRKISGLRNTVKLTDAVISLLRTHNARTLSEVAESAA